MPLKRIAGVFILLACCLACERQIKAPPPELLGLWTTAAPTYQGRYLRFELDHILFGIGGDESTSQSIVKIYVRQEGQQTRYTFHTLDADGAHQLVILYDPSAGGSLQIRNQANVVWTKPD